LSRVSSALIYILAQIKDSSARTGVCRFTRHQLELEISQGGLGAKVLTRKSIIARAFAGGEWSSE